MFNLFEASRIVLMIVLAVMLFVCGGGSGGQGGPTQPDTQTGPKLIPPSAPGYLDASPRGLILKPGERANLSAQLYDSEGVPLATPSVTWKSETPDLVSVDSNGVVQALKIGLGGSISYRWYTWSTENPGISGIFSSWWRYGHPVFSAGACSTKRGFPYVKLRTY